MRAHLAFLVPSVRLSGGINVVVEHATRLADRHGYRVSLVVTHHADEAPWPYPGLDRLGVMTVEEAATADIDLAIATWWDTVPALWRVGAKRHAYFVQSLEDRFHHHDEPERDLAALTYALPLPVITEARWIVDALAPLHPDDPPRYVRNGINKELFGPIPEAPPDLDGPLRVLIETGVDWYKGLEDALAVVGATQRTCHVTLVSAARLDPSRTIGVDEVLPPLPQHELAARYAASHVLLKTSRVEGMYGPPLEAFHLGATVLTTPVSGHDEFVQHGWNGLVADWDDTSGMARLLDLLDADRRLLTYLRTNALATARGWPSWDQASDVMAIVIASLLDRHTDTAFSLARPLYDRSRHLVERHGFENHRAKVKLAAEGEHIAKLDGEVIALHGRLGELEAGRQADAAVVDAAARTRRELEALRGSRWLRLLDSVERRVRRVRPGPTVLDKVATAADRIPTDD